MRLIRFDEPGPPTVLQCLDVPVPEPKSGEVLIRAHAIGVGIPDTLIRAGTYGFMPPLPATPGTELSNQKVRNVIDTITSKAVLILGRFTDQLKAVLDALREELRKRDYLPILIGSAACAAPSKQSVTITSARRVSSIARQLDLSDVSILSSPV